MGLFSFLKTSPEALIISRHGNIAAPPAPISSLYTVSSVRLSPFFLSPCCLYFNKIQDIFFIQHITFTKDHLCNTLWAFRLAVFFHNDGYYNTDSLAATFNHHTTTTLKNVNMSSWNGCLMFICSLIWTVSSICYYKPCILIKTFEKG